MIEWSEHADVLLVSSIRFVIKCLTVCTPTISKLERIGAVRDEYHWRMEHQTTLPEKPTKRLLDNFNACSNPNTHTRTQTHTQIHTQTHTHIYITYRKQRGATVSHHEVFHRRLYCTYNWSTVAVSRATIVSHLPYCKYGSEIVGSAKHAALERERKLGLERRTFWIHVLDVVHTTSLCERKVVFCDSARMFVVAEGHETEWYFVRCVLLEFRDQLLQKDGLFGDSVLNIYSLKITPAR